MSEKKQDRKGIRDEPPRDAAPMDVELLKQLVDLMAANNLSALDLRDGTRRIALKREHPTVAAAAGPPAYPTSSPQAPAAPPTPPDPHAGLVPIKSPMVGTFYLKPAPDAAPFVSEGSTVDENTEVCTIEAMKVYNNIKAECRGTIAKVVAENGKPVEFGQVLFLVRP